MHHLMQITNEFSILWWWLSAHGRTWCQSSSKLSSIPYQAAESHACSLPDFHPHLSIWNAHIESYWAIKNSYSRPTDTHLCTLTTWFVITTNMLTILSGDRSHFALQYHRWATMDFTHGPNCRCTLHAFVTGFAKRFQQWLGHMPGIKFVDNMWPLFAHELMNSWMPISADEGEAQRGDLRSNSAIVWMQAVP